MSKVSKIGLIILIIVIALVVVGYVLVRYTTFGLQYRSGRLKKQIDERYENLQQTYEKEEAQDLLAEELSSNRLLNSATFEGDVLVICYIDNSCEDYLVGIQD